MNKHLQSFLKIDPLYFVLLLLLLCLGLLIYIGLNLQADGVQCLSNPINYYMKAENTSCVCTNMISKFG